MRGTSTPWPRCRMKAGNRFVLSPCFLRDLRAFAEPCRNQRHLPRRTRRRKCALGLLTRADVNGVAGVAHGLRGKISMFFAGNEENIECALGQHAGERALPIADG